jgi:hypothetical protein
MTWKMEMYNGNKHKKLDIARHEQLNLFDGGIMISDPGPKVKAAMRDADKEAQAKYSMSRENIIDDMNRISEEVGITCNGNAKKVTLAIYNKWLSSSEKHHIPLRLLPVFCRATRNVSPLHVYAEFFGNFSVIDSSEIKKLKWAEVEIQRRQLSKKARKLAEEVGL